MSKTFSEAFAAARKAKGPGATFTWNGKKYSTDRADDTAKPKARPNAPAKSPRPQARMGKKPEVMSEAPKQPKAPSTPAQVKVAKKDAPKATAKPAPKKETPKGGLSDRGIKGTGGISDKGGLGAFLKNFRTKGGLSDRKK